MSLSSGTHWTQNEDLLERFVLNKLGPDIRAQLEAHLQECVECRERVATERQLAAGIRRAAREEVKSRLKDRVRMRPARRVNWYQVAGVAAMIVFLVTVGIVNRWFFVDKAKEMALTEEPVQKVEQPVDESTRLEAGRAAPAEAKDKKGAALSKPAPETVGAAPMEKDAERKRETPSSQIPIPLGRAKGKEAHLEEARLAARPAEGQEAERLDRAAAVAGQVWVEGTVLEDRMKKSVAPQFALPDRVREIEVQKGHATDSLADKGRAIQALVRDSRSQAFSISQLPLSSLPQSQRQRQQSRKTVQALIEQKKEVLLMTLYADPPFDDSALQNARVDFPAEDSLIVDIGSQRIVYKLPAEWANEIRQAVKRRR